jgi:Tetracyclin repressor-like, C-terminal domain
LRSGGAGAELDPDVGIDLIFGPMVYRLLVGHGPLDDADAEAMVAAVFCGVQVAPANNHTTSNRSRKGKNHD